VAEESPKVRRISPPDIPPPSGIEADVVVLPREVDEDGRGLYHDSAITLVKEFTPMGVQARYAHNQDARLWYGEKAFGPDVVQWAIGIASQAGWVALVWLLRRKHNTTHVRLRVARCRQTAGETTWEWYEVEGSGAEVAEALSALEPAEEVESAAKEELEEEAEG
jgi:hypothetical protein